MNDAVFLMPEEEYAKKIFKRQASLQREVLLHLLSNAQNNDVFSGRISYVSDKTQYVIVEIGHGIKGFLSRKYFGVSMSLWSSIFQIGRYINFTIDCPSNTLENSSFEINRKSVVRNACHFHLNQAYEGTNTRLQAQIVRVFPYSLQLDIGGGYTEAYVRIENLVHSYLRNINERFSVGELIYISPISFSENLKGFEVDYKNVRQENEFKMGTILEATLIKENELKANTWICKFEDKNDANAIVVSFPQGLVPRAGMKLPVMIKFFNHNTPVAIASNFRIRKK